MILRKMRLREMQAVLFQSLPKLALKPTRTKLPQGIEGYVLVGVVELREALRRIAEIEPLQESANAILALDAMKIPGDRALLENDQSSRLLDLTTSLMTRGTDLYRAIVQVLPAPPEHTVIVRLPQLNDLQAFAKELQEIDTYVNQVLLRVAQTHATVEGVDVGSTWIVLGVTELGLRVVNHFLEVVERVLGIAMKYRREQAELRKLELEGDVLVEQAKLARTISDQIAQRGAEDFVRAASKEDNRIAVRVLPDDKPNPEVIGQVKRSIIGITNLVLRGGAVYAALPATPDGHQPPPRILSSGQTEPIPELEPNNPQAPTKESKSPEEN